MRCTGCRRTITDQYRSAMGGNWHAGCFCCQACRQPIGGGFVVDQNAPFHADCLRCAHCDLPLGDVPFLRKGEKTYHQACFTACFARPCKACTRPIEGKALEALDGFWHPGCFVCGDCRKPVTGRKFLHKNGLPFHEDCYHRRFTRRCDVCRQPLVKGGLQDIWGHTFCKSHKGQVPDCFSCGRLICDNLTEGGKRYNDGRNVCNLCFASAVVDQDQAVALVAQVRTTMTQLGFSLKDRVVPFRLVDRAELDRFKKSKLKNRPVMGMARSTKTTNHKGVVVGRAFEEIIVLYGMPAEHFETVVAHELCHAWLFFNQFDGLPLKVEEGLCTLTEYLYLRRAGTKEASVRIAMLEKADDPIYGAGFRVALRCWRKKKLPGLLRYVQQNRRFPSGFSLLFS